MTVAAFDLPASLPVTVDRRQVLRLQGYKTARDVPTPQVLGILEEALREAEPLIRPRFVFETWPVAAVTEGTVELAGGARLALAGATRRWGPIQAVGLGVCTLGEALERRVDELLARREFPVAFMLDSVGWAGVEALAGQLGNWICNRLMAQGVKATPRLAPGYTGWDIWDQRVLFDLLAVQRIGVRLNDSCVMIPGKSLSFGMGLGPDVRVDQTHKCRRCDLAACDFRLAPYRGERAPGGADRPDRPGDHAATLRHLFEG
jgi:hypothetical protein